jgi:hypothetical protein
VGMGGIPGICCPKVSSNQRTCNSTQPRRRTWPGLRMASVSILMPLINVPLVELRSFTHICPP